MFFPKLKNTQSDPNSLFNLQIGHEFMENDTPIDDFFTNPHSIWWFGGLIWRFELITLWTLKNKSWKFSDSSSDDSDQFMFEFKEECSWKLRLITSWHMLSSIWHLTRTISCSSHPINGFQRKRERKYGWINSSRFGVQLNYILCHYFILGFKMTNFT